MNSFLTSCNRQRNNLLVLDLDLTFDYINIETMIDLSIKQQDAMEKFILTYCSLVGDYQSNISAGMLYAFKAYRYLFSIIT